MLQIKNIRKTYVTGDLTQVALDGVSFNLRNSELVAILGQSGSGKTTTLNIIGGLDRYDSGDIIINNISTKNYADRDWDSYRNHTIGFVFQSYNLIPHQTILANVELALTISGVSKKERKRRAAKALEDVGLKDQLHKKPNQMSGGQMQRVAIARALVNDPDILLADEPTGALDSETSVVVMNLLKEIAKDRLVVLVTHNQELAQEYATRIIKLHDGQIISDSNPFEVKDTTQTIEHKNLGKTSMSFFTALTLSFNNLRTKKARTFLTSFAGSIGIIGIALILSLSTGVNQYIDDIQRDTLASYPITLETQTFDLSSILEVGIPNNTNGVENDGSAIYSNSSSLQAINQTTTSIKENNLTSFKKYLDDPNSEIHQYVGSNGIIYSYNVSFEAYALDVNDERINTNGSSFDTNFQPQGSPLQISQGNNPNFSQIMYGQGDQLISDIIYDNYDLVKGSWPNAYDEVILVVDRNNEISLSTLYELGLLPAEQYREILEVMDQGETYDFETQILDFDQILNHTFQIVPASNYYIENEDGTFEKIEETQDAFTDLLNESITLKITGIVQINNDDNSQLLSSAIGYTRALSERMIDTINNSPVVLAQQNTPDINVLNGLSFEPKDDNAKIEDTITYLEDLGISGKADLFKNLLRTIYGDDPSMIQQFAGYSEIQLANMLDQYLTDPDDEVLLGIYDTNISIGSFDENMTAFGWISLDAPTGIDIYTDSFEAKDGITTSIENYNKTVASDDQITYTDYIGLLMSSITTIVNVVSYVLIAFVAVSLVVSSIMIGIITYISVLERTKEIGILRAIGASKLNISNVFNAETFIVGLLSGILGIGFTQLLLIPLNSLIHIIANTNDVNAALPLNAALILILLSLILTVLAGLIPASKAAKQDPVIALRSE
ncbi:MAG: ABC transporter ATP-binding protein/permease [Erysipelothrix sp.]|nr:ABC transporter ATP-binding protein/permease [Erysipelothrix sp.]